MNASDPWYVLIADDVSDIQMLTKLALEGLVFSGRPIHLDFVSRGDEVVSYLAENPGTALVVLDLFMEDQDSGVRAIEAIRRDQKNWWTRILVQSGGSLDCSPEDIIMKYDINGFIAKGYGGVNNLRAAVITALRASRDIERARCEVWHPTRAI